MKQGHACLLCTSSFAVDVAMSSLHKSRSCHLQTLSCAIADWKLYGQLPTCDAPIHMNNAIAALQHVWAGGCGRTPRPHSCSSVSPLPEALTLWTQHPTVLLLTAQLPYTAYNCLWMFPTLSFSATKNSITACCCNVCQTETPFSQTTIAALSVRQPCTRPVQKVSDLWLGKIHLHAWKSAAPVPYKVISFWLNTLLPVVLPLFEAFLECLFANGVQLSHHVPYNVVSWLKSSHFQLRFQVGEQPKITRSHVGRVGSLSNHRNVVFGQESLNKLRGMSWCVAMIQLPRFSDTLRKDKSSVKTECAEPVLIPTSSTSSRTVTRRSCMAKVRTWSMSSSFWLVEGLPERSSLSTAVRPFFNRFYRSLICVIPMASSPKPRWNFWMVSTWLSPSFWQNLMQCRCSSRSSFS